MATDQTEEGAEAAAWQAAGRMASQLDTGPKTCVLLELLQKHSFSTVEEQSSALLAFGRDLETDELVDELFLVNSQVEDALKDEQARGPLTKTAVARHIFYSHKIEFCSTETVADTEALLTNKRAAADLDAKEKLVLHMFRLLQDTYQEDAKLRDLLMDYGLLPQWLTTMIGADKLVTFRLGGCYAEGSEGTKDCHVYPHHSIVTVALARLSGVLPSMARHVDDTDTKLVMANTFRIAAFAQFHTVDIHPFNDGNGRLCRFISKRILDSVLPIPIAMFEDRDGYLQMLRQGRTVDPLQAPEALFKMLLRVAIDSYRRILCMHGCVPSHDDVVVAMSLVTAQEECQRHLHADDVEAATCWFQAAFIQLADDDNEAMETILDFPSGRRCRCVARFDLAASIAAL